ncbi:hypothetical protein CVT25_002384 [Psilocybe cyanescens]|uniref:Uncharacterized protein n=1 Tax=Psilocybe cyanescens TaxID=93625 RepID=A0A409WK46_PSICY|nr:hypothetical protein CVT25_002384 [Psilocybe cyanescens]
MVSELILLLRTWSLWERSTNILRFLATLSLATFVPGIVVTVLEIESFKFGPIPEGGRGCNLQSASKLIMVAYILVGVSETVVVALTAIKGFHHTHCSNYLWHQPVITLANIIIPLVASEPQYKNYLVFPELTSSSPQRVFHSIFCNRVILLIQGQLTRTRRATNEIARARSISKSNYTGNIVESGMEDINSTREPELLDLDDDTQIMEMSTYHQDWTM